METINTETTYAVNLKKGDRYLSKMRGGEFKTVSSWYQNPDNGKIRIGHTDGDVAFFDKMDTVRIHRTSTPTT